MQLSFNVKLLIAAGVVSALLLAGFGLYNHGYNVASLECEAARAKQIESAVAKAKEDWEASSSITTSGIKNVQSVTERIVTVEKKIPVIVSKCDDVGADYAGVYNELIDAIKSGSVASGSMATEQVSNTAANGSSSTEK